jgi:hypothetical protein
MITKPQADFLARAFRAPITVYGSDYRVAGNLRAAGLIQEAGKSIGHSTLFAPTAAGLQALRDFRAKRWADHGCVAYLQDLQEVEAALADRVTA